MDLQPYILSEENNILTLSVKQQNKWGAFRKTC